MKNIILSVKDITKHFPGILANDHINFDLYEGEIHSILGENGAGKTTFMNILDGLYIPDEGEIYIKGKKAKILSPIDAMNYGIGMIHQHFMLVDTLTVLENVILGLKDQGIFINESIISKKISEISEKYNFKINPKAKIWQLSLGEQQRVEIIKMLIRGTNILILDEPTAVLTPQETDMLFDILQQLKSEGKSAIFISHKLEEVMDISDRITILRKGKVVGTVDKKDITATDLATMMVGREVFFSFEKKPLDTNEILLKIENLEGYNDRGVKTLKGLNLTIYRGEIFGIAGIGGNGQEELVEIITGLRKATKGKIFLKDIDITNSSPSTIIKKGVSYIPSDKLKDGLIPNLTPLENSILKCYYKPPIYNRGIINYINAKKYTENLINEYNVMVPLMNAPVRLLSGGNLQKLLLAREISENPILLIAVHPTRGLDINATEFIRKKLLEVRNSGTTVLLISEDLDELLMISDRIGVIFNGKIVGIVNPNEVDIKDIGLMMGGSRYINNKEGEF